MGDGEREHVDALDDIAYLARSENRLTVLESLTETIPPPGEEPPGYRRRELEERTDISKTTLSRIITEFEERGWARRTADAEYVATPQGQHVAVQFAPFLGSMEAIRALGEDIAMVPPTELDAGPTADVWGLHPFGTVDIHHPSPYTSNPLVDAMVEVIRESTTFRTLTWYTLDPAVLAAMHDGVTAGNLTHDSILPGGTIEHIYGPDQSSLDRDVLRETVSPQDNRVYRYDGHIPCSLWLGDERVLLENAQANGIEPVTYIDSRDETVWQWAHELFERYRADAEERPLDELFA